jgi:hypothetical protein
MAESPQLTRDREIDAEFRAFLNSDRSEEGLTPSEVVQQRGARYVEIHARLVRLFAWRGCHDPETLADRALDRAKQRWIQHRDAGDKTWVTDPNPVGYVSSFVRFIFLEWLAEQRARELPPHSLTTPGVNNAALECLDECLDSILEPEERALIREYYEGEKRAKIDHRSVIAGRHSLSVNALRIECCRIRRRLRSCVLACMRRRGLETNSRDDTFPSGDRR